VVGGGTAQRQWPVGAALAFTERRPLAATQLQCPVDQGQFDKAALIPFGPQLADISDIYVFQHGGACLVVDRPPVVGVDQ